MDSFRDDSVRVVKSAPSWTSHAVPAVRAERQAAMTMPWFSMVGIVERRGTPRRTPSIQVRRHVENHRTMSGDQDRKRESYWSADGRSGTDRILT